MQHSSPDLRSAPCRTLLAVCLASCTSPSAPDDASTGATTGDSGSANSESTAATDEEAFARACDLGPGWLADDALRRSCSDWLVAYCEARSPSECEIAFSTSDERHLGCFTTSVAVSSGGSCAPAVPRCMAGIQRDLHLCHSCDETVNAQAIQLDNGDAELVMFESPADCGVGVFVDGYDYCFGGDDDPVGCACACAP